VPFQVVDTQEGAIQCHAQGAGNTRADQQGAGQAGPLRVGHEVDGIEFAACIGQHLSRQGHHAADVVS
jgi:hypothetical protein